MANRNRALIFILVLVVVLTGCQDKTQKTVQTTTETLTTQQTTSKTELTTTINMTEATEPDSTEIRYAAEQVYRAIYNEEVETLNYLVTATDFELGLAANFVDTLIDYNNYGQLVPSLAESWSCSDDGLVWTIKLREGVNWYTWDGHYYAETVAQDFVDALKYSFDANSQSKTANIAYDIIKNGRDYNRGRIKEFEKVGVKAIDKYTLEYTLEASTPHFLSMLNYAAFLPVNGKFLAEKGEAFGTTKQALLYNGAYLLSEFEPRKKRVLIANKNYWDKANVHIKALNYTYNKKATRLAESMFLKGEISELSLDVDLIEKWLADTTLKQNVHLVPNSYRTYCYALNFDPHYDAAFAPDDWRIAVNNLNFRKALFYGFDQLIALEAEVPDLPSSLINNTITPKSFVNIDGKDYTRLVEHVSDANTLKYNEKEAKEFMAKAVEELADKVAWPIKVVMPYNMDNPSNLVKAEAIEQQLEDLFGSDTINLYILPFAATDYSTMTRRAGRYSLMEVNWRPEYADPHTFTKMFVDGNYNFPELTTEVDQDGNNKYSVYKDMVAQAETEKVDLKKRYELYANAESYVLDNAWVIPYRRGGGGYWASLINPFERPFAPFGIANSRFKGVHILAQPITAEQLEQQSKLWQASTD